MIMIDDRMMNDVCMKVNAFQQEQLLARYSREAALPWGQALSRFHAKLRRRGVEFTRIMILISEYCAPVKYTSGIYRHMECCAVSTRHGSLQAQQSPRPNTSVRLQAWQISDEDEG